MPDENRRRHALLRENAQNIVLLNVEIVMRPVGVPLRVASTAIVQRENAPPGGIEAFGQGFEILGGAGEARQADHSRSLARRGKIEIMEAQAVSSLEVAVERAL